MIKRISLLVFSVLFLALIIQLLIPQKAVAASSNQTETNTTTIFTIRGGNLHDSSDANGKPILKPEHSGIMLNASLNGRTAELPVGSKVVLWFPGGGYEISIKNPPFPWKNVVDAAKGIYHLPKNEIGLLEVVGQGTATITVTKKVGSVKSAIINSAETNNHWSGYAHNGTSGSYTDITSYWTVPTASCGVLSTTDASAWLGIDGNNDGYLIQTGTESYCDVGFQHYRAWYEVINTPTNPEPSVNTCTNLNAGDSMFAEVKQVSGTTWTITIKDLTQNLDCSPTSNQTFIGPQSSAEWILERPATGKDANGNYIYATLTNYGSTAFFNNTVNGANPQHSYATDSIDMVDSNNNTISTTSYPNNLTDAFSVYYCPSTGCPTATPPSEGWSVQSSPNGDHTINQLSAITSTSTSDAWGIGYSYGSSGDAEPLATHWNGSTWGSNAISGNAGDYLLGVNAISSSNVLAVGYKVTNNTNVGTVALQYNGTSWSSIPSDSPGTGPTLAFHAVGSDSSGDAWAVGEAQGGSNISILIEKYVNSSTGFQNWTLTGSDSAHTAVIGNLSGTTQNRLFAVTVNSSTDAWAVGSYYDSNNHEQPLTYHWNGTSWTNVTAPLPSGSSGATLRGVTEVSASNVWAVGTTSDYKTYIIHYDGSSWSVVSSPNPGTSNDLFAISAASANEVYAVGEYATSSTHATPLILKYDGTQWQQETAPSEGSGLSSFGGTDFHGVTVPASGEAFAVGYFAENGPNYTFIDRLSIKYAPTTQATLSPTQNSDGTYPNPVTVTLTALPPSGATIAHTYYTIDSGSQQTYSSAFTVSGAGSHTITYWSVDSNGNQEATNSKTFTIQYITLRSSVSANNGSGGSTLTINAPSGVAVGDVMVAHVVVQTSGNSIAAPSGWNIIKRQDTSSNIATATYWKAVGSSEPSNYTWNFGTSGEASGGIASYTNVDTTHPIDASTAQYNNGISNMDNTGVTTTTANDMLVYAVGIVNPSTSVTLPTGFTQQWKANSTTATSSDLSQELFSTASATGTIHGTLGGNYSNITQLVALRQAGSPAPTPPSGISLRSSASANSGSGSSSLTINVPSGTQNGDVMVAHVIVQTAGNSLAAPTGWNIIKRQDTSTNISTATYFKVAGSSEPSSYTWTFGTSGEASGGIGSYIGVNTTTPIDTNHAQYNNGVSNVDNAGVTTTVSNDMLVYAVGIIIPTSVQAPSGFTEGFYSATNSKTTSQMFDEIDASTGATGTIHTTIATGNYSTITQLIALMPLGSSTPAPTSGIYLRSSSASTTGGNGSSLTLLVPSGTQNGDVMIAHVVVRTAGNTITAPSGWTQIVRKDTGSALSTVAYWKAAGSSEPSSYTWNFGTSGEASGGIGSYVRVNATSPIDASNGQLNASSNNVDNAGVTTTASNDMLVYAVGIVQAANIISPSGFTEGWYNASNSQTTSEITEEIDSSTGATGTIHGTENGGGAFSNVTLLIALKPQ